MCVRQPGSADGENGQGEIRNTQRDGANGGFLSSRPEAAFAENTLDFLAAVSDKIRRLPRNQAGEELKSLGFWLRRPHLLEMKILAFGAAEKKTAEQKTAEHPEDLEIGRQGVGLTFHIAPSNVPLMFFYSGALALLAGNSCLIRLSERCAPVDLQLCELIDEVLQEERFADMRTRLAVVSYDRNRSDLTERFSLSCDARVIWGGDQTVDTIRRIPLNPAAVELTFPNRTSMAVLDADAVAALSEEELRVLAVRFYNDTFAMDQNACSCPRIVFWKESCREACQMMETERQENSACGAGRIAAGKFWDAVAEEAKVRYALSESVVSRKYGQLWELACAGAEGSSDGVAGEDTESAAEKEPQSGNQIRRIRRWDNWLYVLELAGKPDSGLQLDNSLGIFWEYHMKNPDDWKEIVTEKMQTMTTFGIPEAELWDCVRQNRLKGIYRIVPVGQALWMEPVWDGRNIIGQLSRSMR